MKRNMRLVVHVIRKYQYTNYDNEDLLSVGTIGLIEAVNTFSVNRDSRLATYTTECMENEILMLLRTHKKYSREVPLFESIGVNKDEEATSLVDMIEMDNRKILKLLIVRQDVKESYKALEIHLKDSEKTVIDMRYGLLNGEEYTQREVAGMLGIFRSYVSRIEKEVVERLKTEFGRHR